MSPRQSRGRRRWGAGKISAKWLVGGAMLCWGGRMADAQLVGPKGTLAGAHSISSLPLIQARMRAVTE